MKRHVVLASALFVFGLQAVQAIDAAHATAPAQSAAARLATSRVTVTVPDAATELAVEGKPIPGDGTSRSFETPPLAPGTSHRYTFTATWKPNTYTK